VLLMLAAQSAKSDSGEAIKSQIREVSGSSTGQAISDPCEALKILKEGKKVKYEGASGDLVIDPYGDVVGSYDVWQVQDNGKLKVVGNVTPTK